MAMDYRDTQKIMYDIEMIREENLQILTELRKTNELLKDLITKEE